MRDIVYTSIDANPGPALPVDMHGRPEFTIQVTGAGTYTVQTTIDNVLDPSITPTWFDSKIATLVGASTPQQASFIGPYSAFRLNSSAAGTKITILQAGLNG